MPKTIKTIEVELLEGHKAQTEGCVVIAIPCLKGFSFEVPRDSFFSWKDEGERECEFSHEVEVHLGWNFLNYSQREVNNAEND